MTSDWRESERLCSELAAQSARTVLQFWAPRSATFRVAYAEGENYSDDESPNAATSRVGITTRECGSESLFARNPDAFSSLTENVQKARAAVVAADVRDALPLRSFGPLPLFSATYLAQFLADSADPLSVRPFVVTVRRVLYAAWFSSRGAGLRGADTRRDHAFLLYQCLHLLRALGRLTSSVDVATQGLFATALADDSFLDGLVSSPSDLGLLRNRCGVQDSEFRRFVLEDVSSGHVGLARQLKLMATALEEVLVRVALAELGFQNGAKRKPDPAALAFSLLGLGSSNARHTALVIQGLPLLMTCCEHGYYPATVPFDVDSKGRVLAVPSIEIANAVLGLVIRHLEALPAETVEAGLAASWQTEVRLVEERLAISISGATGDIPLAGWCSDRAPALDRIDSWITVQAMAFYLRRVALIRACRRREILRSYSWTSRDRLPVTWDSVECPDRGSGYKGVKERIQDVLERRGPTDTAPVLMLYGPPGTSKTTLVEATAQKLGWDLVLLSPSDFVSESIDRVEQRARQIFQDLVDLDRCVVLLDEVDSLLRDRDDIALRTPGSMMEFVVPALLPKLQRLRDYASKNELVVFFATNYYETIDNAILRPGRIDNHLLVLPYTREAAKEVARRLHRSWLNGRSDASWDSALSLTLDVLSDAQAPLVYRDVRAIMQHAHSVIGEPDSKQRTEVYARELGLSPSAYLKANRIGRAYREACAVIARVAGKDIERPEDLTRVEAAAVLKTFADSTVTPQLPEPWRDLARRMGVELSASGA